MKLYMVYEHDYDDSHPHGVFSSREYAQEYITAWADVSRRRFEVNMEVIETTLDHPGKYYE